MDKRGAVVLGGAHGALALARSLGASGVPVSHISNDSPLPGSLRHVKHQIGWPGPLDEGAIPFLFKSADDQFSYAALWDNGKPVAEFTARRTRQYPVDFGCKSTFVEIVEEPGVVEAARTILASIGHHGLVEVEFKRDQRDGSLRLLDVIPRPWSWFGLCSTAGIDLGTMLWRLANDQPNAPAAATPGTAWMYLARDAVAATSLMARRDIGLGGDLRSFGRVRACATFARNDPRPGLIDLPLTGGRVLTRRILKAGHQT
jgi:predicted ATP-grasp superfamily ATP-dependent carboligase